MLASASQVRGEILRGAGVVFLTDPADLDEGVIKDRCLKQSLTVEETAITLAEAKAAEVAARHPGTLVIGADQILECGERWFDKPENAAAARQTLQSLRGRRHQLFSAVAINKDGECLWRHLATAALTMRVFTDAFLDQYIEDGGRDILASVGAYRLEQSGAQLFTAIEGSYFTILGLPLLPLLEFLRLRGVLVE